MTTPDADSTAPSFRHYLNTGYSAASWLLTIDHKRSAILYMVAITLFFFVGGAAAVLPGADDS